MTFKLIWNKTIMIPFIHGKWHAWLGATDVMLSDEQTKQLRSFADWDSCINWLYVNGHREAARALNKEVKK